MLEVFKPFQMPALISAGILFLSYLIITIKMFGIPKSISWTYYILKGSDTKRGLWKREYWFQLFIYLLSVLIIVAGNNLYFLFAGLFLSIVGLAPTVKDKALLKYHMIGAVISIGLCLFDLFNIWLVVPFSVMTMITIKFINERKNIYITYIEICCFLLIFEYLLIRLW